jgi:hypothetical protein
MKYPVFQKIRIFVAYTNWHNLLKNKTFNKKIFIKLILIHNVLLISNLTLKNKIWF